MSDFEAAFQNWADEGRQAQQRLLSKNECLSFEALSAFTELRREELDHLASCDWCQGVRHRFLNLSLSVPVVAADSLSLELERSPGSRKLSLIDTESGARVQSLEVEDEPEPGKIRLRHALDSDTLKRLHSAEYRVGLE